MLHKETVSPSTLELLKKLMEDEQLKGFVLVGGTSLSLQLGHRISVDLDLFTDVSFDESELSAYLMKHYDFEMDFIARSTLKGEVHEVQIDCISHTYPWLSPFVEEESIRLAAPVDIAAMKLNAVAGNGTRIKDFIDLAYLSSLLSLDEMLKAYECKYKSNPIMPLKAITYWNDINFDEPIKMTKSPVFKWKKIEKRLLDMQKYPHKRFEMI